MNFSHVVVALHESHEAQLEINHFLDHSVVVCLTVVQMQKMCSGRQGTETKRRDSMMNGDLTTEKFTINIFNINAWTEPTRGLQAHNIGNRHIYAYDACRWCRTWILIEIEETSGQNGNAIILHCESTTCDRQTNVRYTLMNNRNETDNYYYYRGSAIVVIVDIK